MGKVPSIVYRILATHKVGKTGYTRRNASTGAVTLIQRFGSALNLNRHFHTLFLDGGYVGARDYLRFQRVKAPDRTELESIVHVLSGLVGCYLERQGLLVRYMDNSDLALESGDETNMGKVLGSTITYRVAIGPRQGCKAFA
jgi:hypothetical protein